MANELLDKKQSGLPLQRPRGIEYDVLDGINAVATGIGRGLTGIAGLPVDTVANVRDLGKAAMGSTYQALTGRPAPDALTLGDRADDVGSAPWIQRQMRRAELTRAVIDAQNPDYDGGYLQNAGAALAGIGRPSSWGELAARAANNATAATAGKAVGETTGSPELALAAGMLPIGPAAAEMAKRGIRPGAQKGPAALARRLLDGEPERLAMQERIQELRNAGVDKPTLGLASGNPVIGRVENWLKSKPGAVDVMRKARDDAVAGLQGTVDRAADLASLNRGPDAAGAAIQLGLRKFEENLPNRQKAMNDRVDALIPAQTPVNVDTTQRTLAALNAETRGASALSRTFQNPQLQAIERSLLSDLGGGSTSAFSGIGLAPRAGNTLPYEAVTMARARAGHVSDVPSDQLRDLQNALSQDLRGAAQAAGPRAEQVFDRVGAFAEAGKNRMDLLRPYTDVPSTEAFHKFQRVAGDSLPALRAVKKSLPEGARGDVAGTMINDLGRGAPGPQGGAGGAWSQETFLDNWNRMPPQARDEWLSGFPNAPQVKRDLEAVAQTANLMRSNSKMWAQPVSAADDAAAKAALADLGRDGLGALLGRVAAKEPLSAGGRMLAANAAARALTSQGLVDAVTRRTTLDPDMVNAQFLGLMGAGLLSQPQPQSQQQPPQEYDYGGLLSVP